MHFKSGHKFRGFWGAEHLPSTFNPTAGHLTAKAPRPWEFVTSKDKKGKFPGDRPGEGGGLGAAGTNRCISPLLGC